MINKTEKLLAQLVKLHPKYIDLSLDRLKILLKKLGNPHLNLPPTIHIAGTNGKGSTLSFLQNILKNNKYTCHAYISPHLNRFNERIIINNKEINTNKLYNTLRLIKKINKNKPITFFEITTAAAFLLFSKYKADFLLLETGLGGRLDATNVITKKELSIITSISIDHQEFLGKTLKKITKEKLGITNYSNNILIAKQKSEVNKIIYSKLKKNNNVFYFKKHFNFYENQSSKFLFRYKNKKFDFDKPRLLGNHQLENASTALASAMILQSNGFKINEKKFNKSIKTTIWPGRLEFVNLNNKKIILDGSHNIGGAEKLNLFLKEKKIKPIVLFGMLNNKPIYEFLKTISNNISKVVAVRIPKEKNAFTVEEINNYCKKISLECVNKKSINDALYYIFHSNKKNVLITGSLYLVGKVREKIL